MSRSSSITNTVPTVDPFSAAKVRIGNPSRRARWLIRVILLDSDMGLSNPAERRGHRRALVARDVLDARDAADATARATPPGRAGGYTYQLAFPDGESRVVETTGALDAVMAANVHTNHELDPSVAEVTFPAAHLRPSRSRRRRRGLDDPVRHGRRARSLTIASGHACTGGFETFSLDDLR
jgi:hypothetical protein